MRNSALVSEANLVSTPSGVPDKQVLQSGGMLPPEEIQLMRNAIEEGWEEE